MSDTPDTPDSTELPVSGAATADSEDRRSGDRRDGDRRRYRDDEGRREDGSGRRKVDRRRRRLAPFVALALLIAGVVFYRSVAVAPVRAAREQAEDARRIAAPILERLALPVQAVPGFAPPTAGAPTAGPRLESSDRNTLQSLANKLSLAATAAPTEPTVYAIAAPIQLALGDERAARLAWEAVLARAPTDEQDPARIGLASLAIRAGLRADEEQDQRFALEAALHELGFVGEESPWWSNRLFEEVVARTALGQPERASSTLVELTALASPVAKVAPSLLPPLLGSESDGEARPRDAEPASGARPARDPDAHDQE